MASTKRANRARLHAIIDSFRDTPDDLVFWSFRYFMGRMTIHACCFAEDLARAWPHLDERVASLIRKELEQEFDLDDKARADGETRSMSLPLGMDCDRAAWECVRRAYTANSSVITTSPHATARTGKEGGCTH